MDFLIGQRILHRWRFVPVSAQNTNERLRLPVTRTSRPVVYHVLLRNIHVRSDFRNFGKCTFTFTYFDPFDGHLLESLQGSLD